MQVAEAHLFHCLLYLGEVLGGDQVVAEENDAAERGVREGLGLGEAAEDAVGEEPVSAHGDEPLRSEDLLRREGEVGDEGVRGVGRGVLGAQAVAQAAKCARS